MNDRVAILIVNGGVDPDEGKWIELCVNKIREHTEWDNYKIYVWNNNSEDDQATEFLTRSPNLSLIQASATQKLAHFHAVPLQKLYEKAATEGAKYIVTMDNDAHPLRRDWLTTLINNLNKRTVVAGIWRDELKRAINPYIHPSCLCTSVDFIEKHRLKFDHIPPNINGQVNDTLSSFTTTATDLGLNTYQLHRSNKNNFHRLMGGIYGQLIYHHGGGNRNKFKFWDEPKFEELRYLNGYICKRSAELIFTDYPMYISWLSKGVKDKSFSLRMQVLTDLGDLAIKIAQQASNHQGGSSRFFGVKRLQAFFSK